MLNPTPPTPPSSPGINAVTSLQAGQSYAGVVRAQPNGLVALVGALQIPLDATAGLEAGQRIVVQVQADGEGLALTIRPQPSQSGTPPIPPTVATLLSTLFESTGHPKLTPHGTALIPRQAPPNLAALQTLVSTLLTDRGIGKDVQLLQQFVSGATAQQVLAPSVGLALSPWTALTAFADPAAWYDMIRRAQTQRNAVARLAQSLSKQGSHTSIDQLRQSIQSLTRQLTDNPAFQQWLQEQGTEETFKSLAQRIQDRGMGTEMQNLRGLDQHYQFLEIPLPDASGSNRLQLHFFSEGKSAHQQGKSGISRTVLDLEMTQLGPVWIDLKANARQCQCILQLTTAQGVAAVQDAATTLEAALEAQGYHPVRVEARRWEGNREEALLSLLAPFQGINLEA